MKAINTVNLVIKRLELEGVFYSEQTFDSMYKAIDIVTEELGMSTHQFEVELAMIQNGYDSFDESAEYIGANGLWDCIEPLASFKLIWERLVAINEIKIVMQDNFFSNNTRDILTEAIDRANELIITDF
jgi:hypothetical protein